MPGLKAHAWSMRPQSGSKLEARGITAIGPPTSIEKAYFM